MKLKAELQPLAGKYYGSIISVSNDFGGESEIHVWINSVSDYKPSERELESDPEFEVCDDHYETQTAFIVCNAIVKALDGLEVVSATQN